MVERFTCMFDQVFRIFVSQRTNKQEISVMGQAKSTPPRNIVFRWEYPGTGYRWYINATVDLVDNEDISGALVPDVTLTDVRNQTGDPVRVYGRDFDPVVRNQIIDAVEAKFWDEIGQIMAAAKCRN
jgi:hypothetical protein